MKRKSAFSGRFALTAVALAALAVNAPDAWSLGLGKVQVQSSLGESLDAEIDVTSMTPEEASNLRVRVASPEAYKISGVDYNAVLTGTQVQLMRRADGRPYLRLTSSRGVQEPFVDVILELNWATGRLVREYTMLFDPPRTARVPASTPPPASIAMAAAAPVPPPSSVGRTTAERRAQNGRISPETVRAARESVRRATAASAPPASVAGKAAGGATAASQTDRYRVRSGDNLSKVAAKTLRPGVSLDQMLVSLYRGNPRAFIDNNMNLLRAGSVLTVPNAAAVGDIGQAEAQQVIQAQSADFNAYRGRLAGGVQATSPESSSRQASGKVQAQVNDQKQAAAAAPDKLTLSEGGGAASVVGPDAQISKDGAKKAADARVAELSKNVDELRQLSGAAAGAGAASGVAGGSPPAAAVLAAPAASLPTRMAPTIVAATPSVPTVATPVPASAPTAAAAASIAAVPVPAAVPDASAPTPSPAAVVAATPPSAVARPASTPRPAPPAVAEQPGVIGSLIEDNPAALGIGALVIALLAGFGIYRFARRSRGDSGETSFLESRLQPDSFFGASGGQRIDTRDAGGTSSSMSYSLSQLDAIGDVDPVAEADVYLAYGRDLQAEEILKEAMRSSPERMAIRTKLLEVYAKRRDTKGFELLATQLFALTRGEGEDWAKAQEMGAQIDPENPLFQPGGRPLSVREDGGRIVEPLGASTMPQSVLPSPSQFAKAQAGAVPIDSGLMDLDLDLDLGSQPHNGAASPMSLEATQAMSPAQFSRDDDAMALDFSISQVPELTPPAAGPAAEPSAFDLSDISLDLDMPSEVPARQSAFGHSQSSDLDMAPDDAGSVDDPMSRKLELADEFRQIGDDDGARDLLNEVVASSSGSVRSRAEKMLADLG